MKTKDLFLNFNFSILSNGATVKAFLFALVTTFLFATAMIATYYISVAVLALVTAAITFVVANLFGIVLAVVLIAAMRKIVLR